MCDSAGFITSSLDQDDGSQVDVVFLDFTKAYYRVSHDRILQKLCNFGISETLLNWSKFYLTNREQRVVIDGKSSTWSVIPQGTSGFIAGATLYCDIH